MLRLGFVLLAFLACAATNGKRLLGLVMIALFLGAFFPSGAAEAAKLNHGCPAGWSHWQYEQRSGCCPPGTSYLWFSDQDQGCFNGGLKAPIKPDAVQKPPVGFDPNKPKGEVVKKPEGDVLGPPKPSQESLPPGGTGNFLKEMKP